MGKSNNNHSFLIHNLARIALQGEQGANQTDILESLCRHFNVVPVKLGSEVSGMATVIKLCREIDNQAKRDWQD